MLSWAKKHKHWLLITAGTITWSLTMVKSGLIYKYGMGFWGANGHDGIWHVALIESLSKGSLAMPILAGQTIQNYHIGFDLLLAFLHRLTFIPSLNLYFQILPPVLALLIGYLTYKLTRNLWSVFFVYFAGSWDWILGKGESTFWTQQSISTLINPPYALSLIFILVGLILIQKRKYYWAGIFFGLLVQIKIYAVILCLAGLALASFKDRHLFKTFVVTILISFPLFFLTNHLSANLLVFQPFWYLETMMGLSDRLNWPRFYSAMTNYRLAHNWFKSISAYSVALIIFVFGNLGTRVILFFGRHKLNSQNIFIIAASSLGLLLPMIFVQSGTPWNTIQFFYYSMFFSSLLAGVGLETIFKTKKINDHLRLAICVLVIVLTIPTSLQTLRFVYLPSRPPAKISKEELEALNFLRKLPSGIVLTPVFDKIATKQAEQNPPRPLYLYESTAYVSALSGQTMFLEDQVNLNITGYDWHTRLSQSQTLFTSRDIDASTTFINDNNIRYIYLPNISQTRPLLSESQLGMVSLFENSQSAIWGYK